MAAIEEMAITKVDISRMEVGRKAPAGSDLWSSCNRLRLLVNAAQPCVLVVCVALNSCSLVYIAILATKLGVYCLRSAATVSIVRLALFIL